jgi:WXG100 family type VII secretion target
LIIAVNHGQMAAAVGQVRATWRTLEQQFAELQGYVKALGGAWQGLDQQAYHAYQQKWNQAATDLNSALSDIGRGIDAANANFQNAQQTNRKMWIR